MVAFPSESTIREVFSASLDDSENQQHDAKTCPNCQFAVTAIASPAFKEALNSAFLGLAGNPGAMACYFFMLGIRAGQKMFLAGEVGDTHGQAN